MKSKAVFITGIFIVSSLIQLISQVVVTRLFGASIALDTFLAAVTLPTIIVTVIYGTLNDAFLPLYGEKRNNTLKDSDKYFSSTVFTLLIASSVIAVVLSLLSQPIMRLLFNTSILDLTQVTQQFSWMIYVIPFAILATLFGTFFYAQKKFYRFPVAQAVGSVVNLFLIIALFPKYGIWSLVFAFVINVLLQIFFVIPKIKISFKFLNIAPLIFAWIPLIVGAIALRSDTLLIRSFGINLGEGSLVYLNLVQKIFSLSAGLLTIGIQVLMLPHLVDYFNQKDYKKAERMINRAKLTSLTLSLVGAVVIFFIAPFVIKLLFVGGKFNLNDWSNTVSLLPLFILPAIGWGVNSIFFQPLIALKKQMHLGIINVLSLAVAWAVTSLLMSNGFGVWSISIGLSILLFGGIIGSEIVWQIEKTPEVSIVILNYQTDQLVLDLVESLGKNPEIEIIVVDNSPEETLGKDLTKVNTKTRYFFKGKNLGFSGGNNYGIKQALGEWILLLNSDTLTTSKDVLSLLEITKKNNFLVGAPKLVGREGKVQNNVGYFDGLLKDPINWLFARPRFIECGELNKEKEVNLLTGAAMLIHKSVFEKMGVLDDKNFFMYFEDIDFSYRLYQKGIEVLYVPQVKILHFGGGSSNKEPGQKNQNYNKGLDNYLLKHRGEIISLLNRKVKALS